MDDQYENLQNAEMQSLQQLVEESVQHQSSTHTASTYVQTRPTISIGLEVCGNEILLRTTEIVTLLNLHQQVSQEEAGHWIHVAFLEYRPNNGENHILVVVGHPAYQGMTQQQLPALDGYLREVLTPLEVPVVWELTTLRLPINFAEELCVTMQFSEDSAFVRTSEIYALVDTLGYHGLPLSPDDVGHWILVSFGNSLRNNPRLRNLVINHVGGVVHDFELLRALCGYLRRWLTPLGIQVSSRGAPYSDRGYVAAVLRPHIFGDSLFVEAERIAELTTILSMRQHPAATSEVGAWILGVVTERMRRHPGLGRLVIVNDGRDQNMRPEHFARLDEFLRLWLTPMRIVVEWWVPAGLIGPRLGH